MPYRIDLRRPPDDALDRLVELGALDVDLLRDGGLAAVIPDGVAPAQLATALGVTELKVTPAVARDDGSVWLLRPRPIRIGRITVAPAGVHAESGAVRLIDAPAFGTGQHPTTALCLEALDEVTRSAVPDTVLDVGTGSGVLALAALKAGVPRALGIDVDDEALRVAAQNARLNGLDARLALRRGGPESLSGTWPLVFANLLAAPLIEMAPSLVRLVGHQGRLVVSGIPASVDAEVDVAYRELGMRRVGRRVRTGWVALMLQATW